MAPPLTAAPTTASNSAAHSPASLQDHDAGTDQERTERVMKHAFPHGVDEQRGRIYSRDQYMSPGTSGSPREMDGIRSSEEEEYSSRAVMKSEDVDPQRMDMSPVQKGDKAETDRRVDEAERIEISREGEASGEAVMQEA